MSPCRRALFSYGIILSITERGKSMEWTKDRIKSVLARQREYFKSGETLDVDFRVRQLKRLKTSIELHEKDLEEALYKDLGRCEAEAFFCDIGSTVLEINETIKGLKKWAKPETKFSGFVCFPSLLTKVYKMPYGVTLIISPFNFPVLLSLGVLAASLAGGNTAMIKVSSKTPACNEVLKAIISDVFEEDYVAVVTGGHDIADMCLEERYDKIFYTGSPRIGRHVMEMAARHLTPVALELGGENGNWCIIRKDADIKDAARKIAFFKMCNSGQICINVNQVAVAEEVAEEFLQELEYAVMDQIGEDPVANPEYPKLISKSAFDKASAIADQYRDRVRFGGYGDSESLKFSPTAIYPVNPDDDLVMSELFNPILPVVAYKDEKIDEMLDIIADREHGLALYIFTKDVPWAKKVMSSQQFGGGCINEVILHLMVKGAPFNGTGHSGMGAYHGIWGFREFTHPQTVLIGSNKFNLPLREHPYDDAKMKLLKIFER